MKKRLCKRQHLRKFCQNGKGERVSDVPLEMAEAKSCISDAAAISLRLKSIFVQTGEPLPPFFEYSFV